VSQDPGPEAALAQAREDLELTRRELAEARLKLEAALEELAEERRRHVRTGEVAPNGTKRPPVRGRLAGRLRRQGS
jgi:hypothetical protein